MPIRQEPTLRTRIVCSGQRFLMSLVASGTCSRILSMSGDTSIWQPSRDLQDRVEKAECMSEGWRSQEGWELQVEDIKGCSVTLQGVCA